MDRTIEVRTIKTPVTKKHLVFFAALLRANFSQLPWSKLKKDIEKACKFSSAQFDTILQLAAEFKDNYGDCNLEKALLGLKELSSAHPSDFLFYCANYLRFNAAAYLHMKREKLYSGQPIILTQIVRYKPGVITQLVNAGLPVDEVNEQGCTALVAAVMGGRTEAALELIECGANVNFIAKLMSGRLPLLLAVCSSKNIKVFKALIARNVLADVRNDDDTNALHLCAENNLEEFIPGLIACGAEVNATDNRRTTPLYTAVQHGNYGFAVKLLVQHSANANITSKHGVTPLILACLNYKDAMAKENYAKAQELIYFIQLLLEHDANVNHELHSQTVTTGAPLPQDIQDTLANANVNHELHSQTVTTGALLPRDIQDILAQDKTIAIRQIHLPRMLLKTTQTQLIITVNVFLAAELLRTEPHELDYQLIRLFAKNKFDFKKEIAPKIEIKHLIFLTKNYHLIKACGLAPVVDQNLPADEEFKQVNQYAVECLNQLMNDLFAPATVAESPLTEPKVKPKESRQEDPALKEAYIKDILTYLQTIREEIQPELLAHPPRWSRIDVTELASKDLSELYDLREKAMLWIEKSQLIIRTKKTTVTEDDKKDSAPTGAKSEKNESAKTLYEKTLPYTSILMQTIRHKSTYCLLYPFNEQGDVGLDVIANAKEINPEDKIKFQHVLDSPKQAGDIGSGIKFIHGENILCRININGQIVTRPMVAEIKIDSRHRIGLYELEKNGSGQSVLACGPYIANGFHDKRFDGQTLPGHTQLFNRENIECVEARLKLLATPTKDADPLTAPPAALSIWEKPAEAVEQVRPATQSEPTRQKTFDAQTPQ